MPVCLWPFRIPCSVDVSPRSEQAIAGVAQTGQYVSLVVELPVERRTVHDDVRVGRREAAHPFRRGDEAEKPNTRGPGTFK
jgi:hypothetical protein